MKKSAIALLCIGVGLVTCVKPYEFDQELYEKVLVVDGLLTDQPGPHWVKIGYTYPLDTLLAEWIPNADVWVEDGDGNRTDFFWSDAGIYESPASFAATTGQSYQLFVEMPDGSRYASEVQSVVPSPEVDSIYGRYVFLPNAAGDGSEWGIQFFIDSDDPTQQARYFRYDYEETYKIQTPYPAQYAVLDDSSLLYLTQSPGVCYKEQYSEELIVGSTIGSSENRMAEFPVRFVSEQSQLLRTRYSILIKQHAISESAYLFYKKLKQNNESGGSLFDRQLGSIFGNVASLDQEETPVLGFFEVSGVTEKRAFFSRQDLDDRLVFPNFLYRCSTQDVVVTSADSAYYYNRTQGLGVFSYDFILNQVSMHLQTCTDCSFYAEVTPPDYWIE